ncbi:MAG: hypothetical protein KAY02_00445 [Acidovorax sp.]|nr:hypothetical protein [Acidovorax sp.]
MAFVTALAMRCRMIWTRSPKPTGMVRASPGPAENKPAGPARRPRTPGPKQTETPAPTQTTQTTLTAQANAGAAQDATDSGASPDGAEQQGAEQSTAPAEQSCTESPDLGRGAADAAAQG